MQILQLTWTNGSWHGITGAPGDLNSPLTDEQLQAFWPAWNCTQTLGLVFGPSQLVAQSAPFDFLEKCLPAVRWVGASTQGAIVADQYSDDSLQVNLVKFEHAQWEVASAVCENVQDSFEIARQLGDALLAKGQLSNAIVFADGLQTAGHEVLRGLLDGTGGVPIAGGMASDGVEFARTWVMHHGRPQEGVISVLGFYGDAVQVSHACQSGAIVFGPSRKVTASIGATLLELDGRAALQVYRDYLGPYADHLPGSAAYFPIAMRRSKFDQASVMRFVLEVDEARQGLRLAGDIPKGSYVQLSRATHQQLFHAAAEASHSAMQAIRPDASTILNIVVSCAGRRVMLGERTGEDLESVHAELPAGAVQTGFFSYGEFASREGQATDVHNMSMAVIAIAEQKFDPESVAHV
jgi:hypothetical protein